LQKPRASGLNEETEIVMPVYPEHFHKRCEEKWKSRAALGPYESARRMPWLQAIGQKLRAELGGIEPPVSEHLGAVLKRLSPGRA
jgi:hypothetical protein